MGAIFAKGIVWFNYFIGAYYGLVNLIYTVILLTALMVILKYIQQIEYSGISDFSRSPETPPVSILIPAYNEEKLIVEMVRSALSINYPYLEVIVINDGSSDGTLALLMEHYSLRKTDLVYREIIDTSKVRGFYYNPEYPGLLVIDKGRGGKADALNCGVNASKSPYICSVDADSIVEKNALLRLVTPIIESPTPVVASGGVIRVLNGTTISEGEVDSIDLPEKKLPIFQIVEYLRAFLFGRVGLDAINGILILSGAFSLFRKSSIIEVGGYDRKIVTEDMEMIVRLHHHYREKDEDYSIKFISDPVCWTDVPETFEMLGSQRRRWHLGLLQTIWKYRKVLFNPEYGRLGLVILPYYLFIEALSPLIEVVGYISVFAAYAVGILSFNFLFLFLTLAIFYGIFLSTSGVFLEEISYRRYPKWSHFFTLLFFGVLENFGYRQLNSFWRVQAMVRFLSGKREWEYVTDNNGKRE